MALFVKLDANWPDHPKMLRAGLDGAGLHATAMCLAKRNETDGWIDRLLLIRYGATDELIDRLINLGLLDTREGLVQPHDWHDRNPSQAAIDATRTSKAEAAKIGNHRRWNHPGDLADCPKCTPKVQVVAGRDRSGLAPRSDASRVRSPETESETESESESETSPLGSQEILTTQPETVAEPSEQKAALSNDQLEQAIRATAARVGRQAAKGPGVANPAAFAPAVTRNILDGPDPTDRQRISDALTAGQTPDQIAASWTAPANGNSKPAGPATGHYRDLEAQTRALLEADEPQDPETAKKALAAIRASRRAS